MDSAADGLFRIFTVSSPQAGSAERSRALAFGDLAFQSGRAARQ
jgi:hypothetical protein